MDHSTTDHHYRRRAMTSDIRTLRALRDSISLYGVTPQIVHFIQKSGGADLLQVPSMEGVYGAISPKDERTKMVVANADRILKSSREGFFDIFKSKPKASPTPAKKKPVLEKLQPTATIEQAWEKLKEFYEALDKEPWEQPWEQVANPPATQADIAKIEAAGKIKLPKDYVTCMKVHNGLTTETSLMDFGFPAIFGHKDVLWEIEAMSDLFDGREEVERTPHGIKDTWWTPKWIPIAAPYAGGGAFDCIDYDPAPGGKAGQIIRWDHEVGPTGVEAPDFRTYFVNEVNKAVS